MNEWLLASIILAFGTLLNAFCSGMETAFFRVAKLRLLLDAREGGIRQQGLLWLSHRPSLVVATLLIGVNIANFLISLAIVQFSNHLIGGGHAAEVIITALLTPLLFIYADLLPKSVAFAAPYALLKTWSPALFVLMALLFPFAALLWATSQLLARILRESPQVTQQNLARKELAKVFDEGHAVGILRPTQRKIAQEIVTAGQRRIASALILPQRLPRISIDSPKIDALRAAAMRKCPMVLVEDNIAGRPLLGYITVLDIKLNTEDGLPPVRPLLQLSSEESHITALHKLCSTGERIAKVTGRGGALLGFILADRLAQELRETDWQGS